MKLNAAAYMIGYLQIICLHLHSSYPVRSDGVNQPKEIFVTECVCVFVQDFISMKMSEPSEISLKDLSE